MGSLRKGTGWVGLRKSGLWLVLVTCCSWTVCGCTNFTQWMQNGFKVGPNYNHPPTMLPEKWLEQENPKVKLGNPNLAAWWQVFGDPTLSKLMDVAYNQNLLLRQARLHIRASEVQRQIARSELLPQGQSMVAGFSHGVVSRNHGAPPAGGPAFGTGFAPSVVGRSLAVVSTPVAARAALPVGAAGTTTTGSSPLLNSSIGAGGAGSGRPVGSSRFFNNLGSSLNLAWELDIWGLFRRNLEAANAGLDQSRRNYDELLVLQFANVATQYIQIRVLQKRIEIAEENVRLQEPLVESLRLKAKAGVAAALPAYYQMQSNLNNTRALIPPLRAALRQTNNQLCNLLGLPVRDLLSELGDGRVPDPENPKNRIVHIPTSRDEKVVLNIPGEILLRRPDVKAAERQLRIQSAQIGIAAAELFPHIGINGTIGLAANKLNTFFNQQSWIGSIGPSMTWNILNYGRLLANVRSQNLLYQQYVQVYQQAILNANQDVENALIAYLQSLERRDLLQASADAAAKLTVYYLTQLNEGYVPPAATSLTFYNQVFVALNFRAQQQEAAAQAEGNVALNLILLYRALGAGWQYRLKDGQCLVPGDMPSPPPATETLPMPRPSTTETRPSATLGAPVLPQTDS